jgi:hypothetical protein
MLLMRAVPFCPAIPLPLKNARCYSQAMKKIFAAALLVLVFATPVFAAGHHHHRHHHHHHHSA